MLPLMSLTDVDGFTKDVFSHTQYLALLSSRPGTSIHVLGIGTETQMQLFSANWIIGHWLGVVTTPRRIPLCSPTLRHSALKCSRASIWIQLIQLKNNPSQALLWETLLREVSSSHEFIQQHRHSAASSSVLQSNVKWELIPLLFSFGIASHQHFFFLRTFPYTAVECNLGRIWTDRGVKSASSACSLRHVRRESALEGSNFCRSKKCILVAAVP